MQSTSFMITDQDVEKEEAETLLSPKNPEPHQTFFLSNIDQTVAFPVETVFFFDSPSSETTDIFERVRRAVAEVLLVDYYFMAGRLRFNPKMNRLELVCNNAGVVFVRATSPLRLSDLGDVSRPNPSFKHLIRRTTDPFCDLSNTPVYAIQVTRFACGGFSIGFVANHSILDGRSAVEMFQNLASICRGEGMKKNCNLNNDRTCLMARDPPEIKYQHDEYIKLADLQASSSFTSPDQPMTSNSNLQLSDTHSYRVFTFTPAMISTLKASSDIPRCSTFEAIVAHIWRSRTKSVFVDNQNATSSVLLAVDIRSKISPPLPQGFIGNGVITARATEVVSDIVTKPLSFCVEKVRKAVGLVSTDEYVRSLVDWLEVYKGVPATAGGNFFVSAWWKLPFLELDFGYGKAVYGGPVVSGMDEFVLLLASGGEDDGGRGINVWMVLDREKMERFAAHVFDF